MTSIDATNIVVIRLISLDVTDIVVIVFRVFFFVAHPPLLSSCSSVGGPPQPGAPAVPP